MRNRRIIVALVVVLLLGIGTVAIVRTLSDRSNDDVTEQVDTLRVDTDGLGAVIPELPTITQEDIDTAVMGAIRKNVESPKDTYRAVYRENSLQKSQASNGVPLFRFLVDVPELQRTFVIEVEGTDTTEYKTLYALCPTAEQSAYGEKVCNVTP